MGFFDFVEDIVGGVVGIIPGASTLLTAVGLPPPPAPTFLKPFTTILNPLTLIPDPISAAVGTLGVTSLATGLLPQKTTLKASTAAYLPTGGPTMSNGFFSDIFGTLGDVFSPTNGTDFSWGDVLDVGTSLAVSAFAPQPTAFPVVQRMPMPVVPRAPMPLGRMGAAVGRSFFNRWPNLATALQMSRNAGQAITRSRAWTLLRNYGPAALTGLGWSALAINELMVAGPGRRKMNVANVKALRRGIRRVEGFNRLASRVQASLSGVCRSRKTKRAAQWPARTCRVCGKAPCRC